MSTSTSQPVSSVENTAAKVWVAALVLVVATLLAYHNSFSVPFLFDDIVSIVENPAIRSFGGSVSFATAQTGGLTTSGRPILALSLALNHAIGGDNVWSYHAVNLSIHVAAALVLFGLVRRTLLTPVMRARFGGAALPLALLIAALWALHPLQTESVTYIVQRAESLAGLLYLLTIYAFVRSTTAASPRGWQIASGVACLLGVATKEVVASAPIVALLYDRTFVSGTFVAAWRRHRGFYFALTGTWLVLAILMIGTGGRGGTAGFDTDITPWSYALTQCGAIVRYLWLTFWPRTLVFDYGNTAERSLADVFPQAVLVLTIVAAVGIGVRRQLAIGFAGLWFLAQLAPSSSFIPIATQTIAEHRMYLPLVAPIAIAVCGAYRLLGSRVLRGWTAVAIAAGIGAFARNADYQKEITLWNDTAAKYPANARAHNNLGQALFRAGKISESIARYERALQLNPSYAEPHYNLGVALAANDRVPQAIEHYEKALRLQPAHPEAHNNLGNVLVKTGRFADAIRHYEQALMLKPEFAEAHHNFGYALLRAGRPVDAEARLKRALEIKPNYAEAHYNLGNAYAATGRMAQALEEYREALTLKTDYAEALVNAGNVLLSLERPAEALAYYERAVTARPGLADAHYNFGAALMELGRWSDAIPRFETVLRLSPAFARAHRGLGFALARVGRLVEARAHYERYLRAAPDDVEAREELRQLNRGGGAP